MRDYLGIKTLQDPIPEYWVEIQKYPNEKKIFSLLALIFTHGGIVDEFAKKYSSGTMKGTFIVENDKRYTNIRSALVVSGAAEPVYRREIEVPYDISIVLYNPAIGQLFKKVLLERFSRLTNASLSDDEFYEECFYNNFHKALGINEKKFRTWIEGDAYDAHYINKISINNFFTIKQMELEFDNSKEIYFLGENGDGKSLLLMALYLAFNGNYINTKTEQEKTGKAVDILRKNKDIDLRGFDEFDNEYTPQQANYIENIYAYGTHRGRYSSDNPEVYGFMSLFDFDQTLNNPVSWLIKQRLLELDNKQDANRSAFNLSTSELEKIFYELLERNVEVKIEDAEVYFFEKGSRLNFEQLSEGYRSIIIFVSDLLIRLCSKAKQNDIKSIKGVVLVDEIDQHLHPRWQRVIVKKLRSLFPKIQFFFTTHSPTIIQGASDDAIIYRVYKEGAETQASDIYFRKDLNHLMIDTLITSPLFGLDDSRLDSENDLSITDDSYLLYKINDQLKKILSSQKEKGKNFINEDEIDAAISKIIEEKLHHDKD